MGSDRPYGIGYALDHMDKAEAAAKNVRPDEKLIEASDAVTKAEVDLGSKIQLALGARAAYAANTKFLAVACNNAMIAREGKEKANNAATKAGTESEKAVWIGAINAIAGAASVAEGAVVKGGTPGASGAKPGAGQVAGEGGGITKSIGAYVGFFVGTEYDKEINQLNQAILLSDKVIAGIQEDSAKAMVSAAKSMVVAALAVANAARAEIIPAENTRRRALEKLAQVASLNAIRNGDKKSVEEANALHALIAGLPAMELVVSKLTAVANALVVPPYSKESGIGAGLSTDASGIVQACAIIRGARAEVWILQEEWQKKVEQARNVKDNMLL